MDFISLFKEPEKRNEPALWFIFDKDKMLVYTDGDTAHVPQIPDPQTLNINSSSSHYLGTLDGVHCYAASIDIKSDTLPEGTSLLSLFNLFGMIPNEIFPIAARASLVLYWDRNNQYCGRCGSSMQFSKTDRAKICTSCGYTSYPRISPAVIAAVIKDRQILLGHSGRFPKAFYSVLAGFVEPGETFEECVKREIKEEVGVEVKNIRYFGSQPWPFPDSLMVGFTAEYAGGEISVDGEEVVDAGWFTPENLPEIPGRISIARQLIDWFVKNYK